MEDKKQQILKSLMDPEYFSKETLLIMMEHTGVFPEVNAMNQEFAKAVSQQIGHGSPHGARPETPRGKLRTQISTLWKTRVNSGAEYDTFVELLKQLHSKYFEDYSKMVFNFFWIDNMCISKKEFAAFVEGERKSPVSILTPSDKPSPPGGKQELDKKDFGKFLDSMEAGIPYIKSIAKFQKIFGDAAEEEKNLR